VLSVQAGARHGHVEQLFHLGRLGGIGDRLDLDVAQREALHEQAARQHHVLNRPLRVAQPQAEHAGQMPEQRHHRPARLRLPFLEGGHDLLPGRAVARRAERGDERGVQPPGGALAQRLVVARHREPEHLP